jgi:U3 small nucleolar RNA-associated protein 24
MIKPSDPRLKENVEKAAKKEEAEKKKEEKKRV